MNSKTRSQENTQTERGLFSTCNSRDVFKAHCPGFTIIELLCVIGICLALAALIIPAFCKSQMRAERIKCKSNLRQIGLAFNAFAHDHDNRFPMQTPGIEGGTLEYVQNGFLVNGDFFFSYRHFQALSNELGVTALNILICPSDDARTNARSFAVLNNNNLSYFVGVNAAPGNAQDLLSGDRNLVDNRSRPRSIISGKNQNTFGWNAELHQYRGNLMYADGHVNDQNSRFLAVNQIYSNTLFMPVLRTETATTQKATNASPGKPIVQGLLTDKFNNSNTNSMSPPQSADSGKQSSPNQPNTPAVPYRPQSASSTTGEPLLPETPTSSTRKTPKVADVLATIAATQSVSQIQTSTSLKVSENVETETESEPLVAAPQYKKPPLKKWLAAMAPTAEDGSPWPIWLLLIMLVILMYLHRRWQTYIATRKA